MSSFSFRRASGARVRRSPSSQRQQRRKLFLEGLEERSLMATFTWTGATDGNWATGSNWVGGVAPSGSTHTLVFNTANLTGANVATTANNIAGLTDITLQITDASGTANFTLAGPNGLGLSSAGVTNTFNAITDNTTLSLNLSGPGGITHNGSAASTGLATAGTLTISGNNTFDGAVAINRGRLVVQSGNALGSTVGATTITGNDGTTGTTVLEITPTGNISIPESLNLNGTATGRASLRNTANSNTWSGNINVSSATNLSQFISDGGALNITGDVSGTLTAGAVLFVRGGSTGANAVSGNVNLVGNLNKTDAGTWTIGAAAKTYSWTDSIFAVGTVNLGAPNVLPSTAIITMGQNDTNTAVLNLNGNSQTIAGLTSNPTAQGANTTGKSVTSTAAATLTINDASARTYASVLSGAGLSVVKQGAGAWTLLGTNTQGGTFTVSAGSVLIGNGGTTGTIGNGLVVNNNTITLNRTDTYTYPAANNMTGTGTVNWSGTGTFNLTGSLSATNPLNVTAGTLSGTGTAAGTTTLSANTILDPATTTTSGTLNTGPFSFNASSSYNVQLSATSDSLVSTGAVTLNGAKLNVSLSGYTGTTGSVYTIVQGTSVTGTFANLGASGNFVYTGNRRFIINYTATSVTLTDDGPLAVPATVYVDDAWAAFNGGAAIADADPQAAGAQTATFGFDAYATINAALVNAPAGATIVVNDGTYAESVTLPNGYTLRLAGTAAATPGTATISNLGSVAGSTINTGTLNNTLAFGGGNASTTLAGAIIGSGSVNMQGTGTVTLTANNSYAGTTTVSTGTLQVGAGGTTGTVGLGNVVGPGTSTIQFNRADNISIPNLFTGTVTLTQIGAGNITFTGGNNNSFRALNLNSITTIDFGSGATSFNNGGAATLSSTNSGTINATGGTITFPTAADNSSSAGELVINARLVLGGSTFEACCNDGFLTLTNANNTMAAVQINNGSKLSVGSFANPGPLGAATSITFNNDAANVLRYTGSGDTTSRSININATTANTTLDNSGTGPLIYTTFGTLGSGAKTIILTGSTVGTAEISATLPDSAGGATSITKNGTGTWILSGNNSFTGATAVTNGTLLVNGGVTGASTTSVASGAVIGGNATAYPGAITVAAGGTFDPGAVGVAGKFNSTGAVNLNTAGVVYRIQLGASTTPGTTYDQLASTGAVNISGSTLSASLVAPVTSGGTYDIITASSLTGTFAGLANNAILFIGGERFQIQYTATTARLVHQAVAPVNTSIVYVNNAWDAGAVVGGDADGAGALTTAILNANAFTSIQAAIDALPAGGGTIVLMGNTAGTAYAGAYSLTKPVTFQFAADTVPASVAETSVFVSGNGIYTASVTTANASAPLSNAAGVTFSGTINGLNSQPTNLDFSATAIPLTFSGAIGGTSAATTFTSNNVTTVGANITTSGAQSFTGTTVVSGAANLTASTLTMAGVTLNANLTATVSGASSIAGNVTGGAFGLTKAGTGVLTLNGTSSYTGNTAINGGTLRLGSSTALNGVGTLSFAGTSVLDLNGNNAAVTNVTGGPITSQITDLSVAAGVSTFTVNAQTSTIGVLVVDGPTRQVGVAISNNNISVPIFTLTNPNTFSGGLTLLHNGGTGTRLYVNSAISNVGTAGAIVSSPFGRGTITVGTNSASKAGVLMQFNNQTILNDWIINTNLGTDVAGLRIDNAGTVFAGNFTTTTSVPLVIVANAAGATLDLPGVISGPGGLTKSGPGLVTLSGANNFTGPTTINAGILRTAGANNRLPTGTTVTLAGNTAQLDLNGFNQSLAGLQAISNSATSVSTSITGTGSSLTVGPTTVDFLVGASNTGTGGAGRTVTLDMSGLASFSYNNTSATGKFDVGNQLAAGGNNGGIVLLANSNTITASRVTFFDTYGGAGQAQAIQSLLRLGTNNTINTDLVAVSNSARSNAILNFRTGLTNPSVTLRGFNGVSAIANVIVGRGGGGGGTITTGSIDLTLGTTDALIGNLVISDLVAGGNTTNTNTGTVTIGAGTLTASSVVLGQILNSNTGTGSVVSGTLQVQNGGVIAANTITVGNYTATVANTLNSTLNVNSGGTLRVGTLQRGGDAGGTRNRAINLNDGVLQNFDASTDLLVNNVTVTIPAAGSHDVNILNGRTGTFNATSVVTGAGSLSKTGPGTLVFAAGSTASYTGTTTVSAGTLQVNNTLPDNAADPDVIVTNGGILGGTGTISGSTNVQPGGAIAPGTSPGILNTANVSFLTGAPAPAFNIEINGTTVGAGYDQLNVTGAVNLGTTTALNVTGTLTPTPGALQQFVIINNDGADPVVGSFAGLPEFSTVTLNGQVLYVSYVGGDGNDVVLSSQPIVYGTPANDTFIVRRQSGGPTDGDIEYSLNGGAFVPVAAANGLNFFGLDGADVLTVDFINGDTVPANGINFDGGNPLVNPGDLLVVNGRGLGNNAAYTPSATITGNGSIAIGGSGNGVINFVGLEPVDITGMAAASFIAPATTTVATLANGFDFATGLTPALRLTGTSNAVAFESVAFWNNTTVTIDTATNGGAGVDALTITSADNAHANSNLTINLGGGADRVNLNGNINTDGNLIFTAADSIVVGASVTIDSEQGNNNNAGNVDLGGAVVSASAVGFDVTINTNVAAGAFNGGNVSLGAFSNAAPGAQFINDLSLNTSGNGGGTSGLTTLAASVQLDENGAADPADFVITGNGKIAIAAAANSTLTVGLDNGTNSLPTVTNAINWNSSNIYAVNTGVTLTLNGRNANPVNGNPVASASFGLVDNNAGANSFLRSFTFVMGNAFNNSSTVNFRGSVFVDGGDIDGTSTSASFTTSLTLDTAQGATAVGGNIRFSNSNSVTGGSNSDLVFDTSAATTGGNITFTNLNNGGPANALNDLTLNTGGATAGIITISGNINTDNNGADTGDVTILGGGVIRLGAAVTIDTENGNNGAGGSINFGTSTIVGNAVGRDLTLNTATTAAGLNGGAVTLAAFSNTGGQQFVNDLSLTTTAGAGGTAGVITLNGNISLDNSGAGAADPSSFTITGGAIAIGASITIDTEQGAAPGDADGGAVNWGSSPISGNAVGRDLTINTKGQTVGGAITIGPMDNAAGAYLNDVIFDTTRNDTAVAGTVGTITLNGNILLDDNGAADPSQFSVEGNGGAAPAFQNSQIAVGVASLLIDTEQGNNGPGGAFAIASNTAAVQFTSTVAGRDLTIDTSTTAAGQSGGALNYPTTNNAGGAFLNDILLISGGGAGGTAGLVTLRDVFLDDSAGDAASLTVQGGGNILFNSARTIDTENGNNGPGGSVDFGTSAISANAAAIDVIINTSSTGAGLSGGAVTLAAVNGANGAFLRDLTITTSGGAGGTAGVLTLTNNITLASSGGTADFTLTGGKVAVATSLTIDTENGAAGTPGAVNFGANSNLYATAAGVTLTINTNTSGAAGGNIIAGLFDDNAGANNFFAGLTVNTAGSTGSGEFQLNGNVLIDGPIALSRRVVAMVSGTLTIDSKQSAVGAGNPITLGGALYGKVAGADLVLNSSATAAGANGGAITLPDAGVDVATAGAPAQALNDLTLNTSAGAGGTAGSVTVLSGVFNLNDNGAADPASLTVVGGGNVIFSVSTTIDTEQGNNGPGGSIDFGTSAISASASARDLNLNTSTTAAGQNGGAVTLAALNNAGSQFINDVTVNTTPGAGGVAGALTLTNNIQLASNGAGTAASFVVNGGGNIILTTSVTIDTQSGNPTVATPGQINFNTSAVSATVAGADLTLDTSNTGAGSVAGSVTLNAFNTAAGFAVNDLTVNTTGPTNATFGAVTLNGAINLGSNGGDTGDFTVDAASIAANQAVTNTGLIDWDARQAINMAAAAVVSSGGTITVVANGDGAGTESLSMAAGSALSTSDASATAVTINVNTAGGGTGTADLAVVSSGAGGTITINVFGGAVTDANGAATNVSGGVLVANAATGIDVDTAVTSTTATTSGVGAIAIDELDAITLTNVTTANGPITVTAGGTITATNVVSTTDNDANDISLTATTGNLSLGVVNAGTTAGDVSLLATAGNIIDAGNDTVTDVTGDAVSLTAGGDIGQVGNLHIDTAANTLTSVSNSAVVAGVHGTWLNEANAVTVTSATTTDGVVVITAGGALNAVLVTAGGTGRNALLTTTAGDITVGLVTATGARINAAGAILDGNAGANNVTATNLLLQATNGIGVANELETTVANLAAANTTAGAIRLANTGAVDVTTVTLFGATVNGVTNNNLPITLTATGAQTITQEVNAGTALVALASGGAILDGNAAANNVTGGSLVATAAGGITLDTTVSQLAVANTTSGNILITNTGGLNITTLSEAVVGTVSGVTNPAGSATVIALSPLTVSSPVSALGPVILTATDNAAVATDNLSVNATVTSTGASVTLNAGDNATIAANLSAFTTVAINIDANVVDPDAASGGALVVNAPVVITATGATFTGNTQADSFDFYPQATTPINVFGLAPVANPGGDTLLLHTDPPTTNPTLNILAGQGAGLYTFGNRANVQYSSIEQATTTTPIHVALDAGATGIETIRLQRSNESLPLPGNDFEVYDGANNLLYAAPINTVLSFLFTGSANANTVTIDDVNGLVDLAGTVPAPTGVGDNPNVAGTPEIFVRGNGGTDALVYANTANNTNQTYGLGTGAGPGSQAGEVLTTTGATNLSVYFDGLEGVTSNDITTPDTGALTIVGDANANVIALASSAGGTTVSATGYVPFTFGVQAFNSLTVNAGDGADTLTLASLNAGEAGLAVTLNGEVGNDSLVVESVPALNPVLLQGGVGNDAYNLGGGLNTVDGIFSAVTVTDSSGTDSLTLVDSADASGDTVTITDSTINGVNLAPAPNVGFTGIEALDVTTSGGADVITTTLAGTNGLVSVNVRGANGDDDFFLSTADGMGTLTTLNLVGDAGSDDFGSATTPIRPLIGPATNIAVYGDSTAITTNPGGAITDHLFLDMTTTSAGATVNPLVIVDTVTGQATAANTRLLRFGGIDDIDLYDGGVLTDVVIGDLYVRATDQADNLIFYNEMGGVRVNHNGVVVNNALYAPTNRIVAYGRAGADYMEFNFTLGSALGADFRGEADNDTLIGGLGADTLVGGGGADILRGGESNDILYGEDQFLTSSPIAANVQRATGVVQPGTIAGNDNLQGGGGNDFLFGSGGDDVLAGGLGDDYVHGGDGNDILDSNGGNDILRGEAGNDLINGGAGIDIILGGDGDDRMFGRGNRDFMLAGLGADQIQDDDSENDVSVSGGLSYDADSPFTLPGASITGLNDNDVALQALMFTGGNAWSGAASFAARVANLSSFSSMTNDGVMDIVIGTLAADDYLVVNANDWQLNTLNDTILTL